MCDYFMISLLNNLYMFLRIIKLKKIMAILITFNISYLINKLAYKIHNKSSRTTNTRKLVIKLLASFMLLIDFFDLANFFFFLINSNIILFTQ